MPDKNLDLSNDLEEMIVKIVLYIIHDVLQKLPL